LGAEHSLSVPRNGLDAGICVVRKARPTVGYPSRQTPPRSHRVIARCEAPRSRLSGVRDRLEAPDPLEDLPEEHQAIHHGVLVADVGQAALGGIEKLVGETVFATQTEVELSSRVEWNEFDSAPEDLANPSRQRGS